MIVAIQWPKYRVWQGENSKPSRFDPVFDLRAEVLLPFIPLLSAIHHAVDVYQWVYSDYRDRTEQGRAWNCWIEYAISASLMNIVIVFLCGNLDVFVHMFVFVCTAVTMFEGVWIEEAVFRGVRKEALAHFVLGCVPFCAVWVTIFAYFADGASDAPDFVYAIVVTLFLLESSFAVNTLYYIHSQRTDTLERTKIILSAVSKSTLLWLVYGGVRGVSMSAS
jgi:hypothetical protein